MDNWKAALWFKDTQSHVPTLRDESQNFYCLNIHKHLILCVVKLLWRLTSSKRNHMSQVEISLSKYHLVSLHLSFSAQSADPLQHVSCITQNFSLKNIHSKKSRQNSQWSIVWASRVEAQETSYCSIRKVILGCDQLFRVLGMRNFTESKIIMLWFLWAILLELKYFNW